MKNKLPNVSDKQLILPETSRTFEGFDFFPHEDAWIISDLSQKKYFNFFELRRHCSNKLVLEFKYVIILFLESSSVSHASNLYNRFLHFIRHFYKELELVDKISPKMIILYKSTLNENTDWYLGVLRILFEQWNDLGLRSIDHEVINLFSDIRIKGNNKGDAVRTMDPEKGPFSEIEIQSISANINGAFAEGRISIEEFLLVMLTIAFGVRPKQLASLKIKDLSVFRAENGAPVYTLNMPRAKQRRSNSRAFFKTRSLIPEIGKLMEAWTNQLSSHFESSGIPAPELPVFPNEGKTMPPNLQHHSTADQLASRITQVCNSLEITSERTGELIKINTGRFRKTVGTRAAEEGHGELIIADLLDHSDTQNVGVYVEATPAMAERIDKATAMELGPIAQMFMGEIIINENDADRGQDPSSRIGNPSIGNVGSCGKYGFCGALAPIACYTCRQFQPWLDAPHEELLETLLSERDRISKQTNDSRMTSINDHTILAVADVVARCKAMKDHHGEYNG